jgi:hypothetical protein
MWGGSAGRYNQPISEHYLILVLENLCVLNIAKHFDHSLHCLHLLCCCQMSYPYDITHPAIVWYSIYPNTSLHVTSNTTKCDHYHTYIVASKSPKVIKPYVMKHIWYVNWQITNLFTIWGIISSTVALVKIREVVKINSKPHQLKNCRQDSSNALEASTNSGSVMKGSFSSWCW